MPAPDQGFTHPDSIPFHYRDNGEPCGRSGQLSDDGRCPDGCDHADHYSNDGHAACYEEPRHG